jgi:hypothetical protein
MNRSDAPPSLRTSPDDDCKIEFARELWRNRPAGAEAFLAGTHFFTNLQTDSYPPRSDRVPLKIPPVMPGLGEKKPRH